MALSKPALKNVNWSHFAKDLILKIKLSGAPFCEDIKLQPTNQHVNNHNILGGSLSLSYSNVLINLYFLLLSWEEQQWLLQERETIRKACEASHEGCSLSHHPLDSIAQPYIGISQHINFKGE